MTVKTLLTCKSYGAESRIGGDVRNSIWGIVAGWEEVITSLELTLELADKLDSLSPETLNQIIEEKYKLMTGNPQHVVVLEPTEVEALVKECAETDLDKDFLEKAYQDIANYRTEQLAR
jgi:hypothetical protein